MVGVHRDQYKKPLFMKTTTVCIVLLRTIHEYIWMAVVVVVRLLLYIYTHDCTMRCDCTVKRLNQFKVDFKHNMEKIVNTIFWGWLC